MKRKVMSVPGMGELYDQRQGYQVHRRKLDQILYEKRRQIEPGWAESQAQANRRHLYSFQCRFNSRSVEVAKQNDRMSQKMARLKSDYKFLSPPKSSSRSRFHTSPPATSQEQRLSDIKMRSRIQSMSSALSSEKMQRDYRKSAQIRDQISHFTQQDSRVRLKVERYVGGGKPVHTRPDKQAGAKPMSGRSSKGEELPTLGAQLSSRKVIDKKLGVRGKKAGEAEYYRREEILRNRVRANPLLAKMRKNMPVRHISAKGPDGVFFTEAGE